MMPLGIRPHLSPVATTPRSALTPSTSSAGNPNIEQASTTKLGSYRVDPAP